MSRFRMCFVACVVFIGVVERGMAAPVGYTDKTAFLNALTLLGYPNVHEGFENDNVWGAVRSTAVGGAHSAPAVTSKGVTWTSSSPNNGISTSSGAAHGGQWGMYSLPHGDYSNGITDGWRGSSDTPLVAIGGWVRTGTPPAALSIFLDGDEQNSVDFGGANALTSAGDRFFGVIDTDGFLTFDFRETEGVMTDAKSIFGDDYYFAFSGTLIDCNENGVADGAEILAGTSEDCNGNLIPDECEIEESNPAPGGPYFCIENCDPDCNQNGILDACEVLAEASYSSGPLSPIGSGSPQAFTIVSPPLSRANVILDFTAIANLGGQSDYVDVDINGVHVGTVFGIDGSDCPENGPDLARIVVPVVTFNNAVSNGNAVIGMTATSEVAPNECSPTTYISVAVTLLVPSESDTDGDGVPDSCQSACATSLGDLDGDSFVTSAD
ncbi:MAG: hypothetical protein KDA33_08135, partial [Phycisphaerales bacterium]|nr:hypothetical protein [Phycisphaerales bacterium]